MNLAIWEAINWIKVSLLSIKAIGTVTRFKSKYKTLHSRKCNWKRCLQNDDHFVSATYYHVLLHGAQIQSIGYCRQIRTQRTHDAIITPSLRQNEVAASFWRNNDVIIGSCVRREQSTDKPYNYSTAPKLCYLFKTGKTTLDVYVTHRQTSNINHTLVGI